LLTFKRSRNFGSDLKKKKFWMKNVNFFKKEKKFRRQKELVFANSTFWRMPKKGFKLFLELYGASRCEHDGRTWRLFKHSPLALTFSE